MDWRFPDPLPTTYATFWRSTMEAKVFIYCWNTFQSLCHFNSPQNVLPIATYQINSYF